MSTAHDRPFAPEPTPVLSVAPPPTEPAAPVAEWAGEKTILIAEEDAQPSTWLQVAETGEWLPIPEFPAVLGRHELATLSFDDTSVSRRHAEIVREGEHGFAIVDLGSSNGVRMDGKKIERVLLMHGDEFQLGNLTLRFSAQPPPEPNKAAVYSKEAVQKVSGLIDNQKLKRLLPVALAAVAVFAALGLYMKRASRTVLVPDAAVAEADAGVEAPASPAAAEESTQFLEMDQSINDDAPDAAPVEPEAPVADAAVETPPVDSAAKPPPAAAATPPPQKQAAVAAPKPKPRVVRRSAAFSRAYIDEALQFYLDGDSDTAIRRLNVMAGSNRNQRIFREEAAGLQPHIEALVADYGVGNEAFANGDREAAAAAWARFLRNEGVLFDGRQSVYARQISRVVGERYQRDGDAAHADGRWHDAYRLWSKAVQYDAESPAGDGLAELQERGQAAFREGYRLESVNVEKAKALWHEVLDTLPPGTEYHAKARAKLRWHEQVRRR